MWELDVRESDLDAVMNFCAKNNIKFTADGDDHNKLFFNSTNDLETVTNYIQTLRD